MKRGLFTLTIGIILIFSISIISAEIILNQQPETFYNLGEVISMPTKIATLNSINGFFTMTLICNGRETEIHKQYISLAPGQEKQVDPIIPLIKSFIGQTSGTCTIKAELNDDFILTEDFKISNLVFIDPVIPDASFNPGESFMVEGNANKENGKPVEGFIDVSLVNQAGEIITVTDTVKGGYFYLNYTFSKEASAGEYSVTLYVYEKDFEGNATNAGSSFFYVSVNQVPTSLEVVFDSIEVQPGTNLQVKTILHDQTGASIKGTSIITIKDSKNKVAEQTSIPTGEFLEYYIESNQPPEEWSIVAVSNRLTGEAIFSIAIKETADITIINKTLLITNTGNVPYNKEVLVKIGDQTLPLNVSLDIDESQKYILTAPDGEYEVQIIEDGENRASGSVALTGGAVGVKRTGGGVLTLVRYPFVWIFIIGVLGFMVFIVAKKGYKKSFIGKIHKTKPKTDLSPKEDNEKPLRKKSLVTTTNKAILSLSIKGEKQDVSLVALKIKNLHEIQSKKGNAEEAIQRIVDLAEESKAIVYENQDNIFFILAPLKTKTFKNQKTAVELAQKIEGALKEHNKMFKQKVNFGISLNCGTIVAKQEEDSFKFMSMGTLITNAKKISSLSHEEILLSEKINDQLRSDIKSEKQTKNNIPVFTIKEVKHQKEETKKFISDFISKLEGKK